MPVRHGEAINGPDFGSSLSEKDQRMAKISRRKPSADLLDKSSEAEQTLQKAWDGHQSMGESTDSLYR